MISIVCPVYNEENYISGLLDYLASVQPLEKEIFFIDGGSKDSTVAIIKQATTKHPGIHLLFNPNRYVPFALNLAIPECRGNIIVRLDAHCTYAEDYFLKVLEVFDKSGADIVGGPTRTAYHNHVQQAVGYAISSRFGVGGSRVHQVNYEGESDSVTFGAWRREIFKDTGLFDTRLKRNQDDEFHYRAKSLGKRIYQSPEIKLYYFPRSTIRSLFEQYFQYGNYKPLVLQKIKSEIKLRHVIPSLFVLYLIFMPVLVLIHQSFAAFLFLYIIFLFFFSFRNAMPIKAKLLCLLVYPTLHVAYGLGFIKGLFFPPE